MGIAKDKKLSAAAELCRQVEEQLSAKMAELNSPRTEEDIRRLVHELEVHQIELVMQNLELHRIQEELELSRNKYAELYDFAPVSYFTFDTRGLIKEVNHAGAQMLGIDKRPLTNKPFISFIADSDGREIFSKHLKSVLQKQGVQRCEIGLKGKDGEVISAQFQSVTVDTIESKDSFIFSAIVDDTVGKHLGEALQKAHNELEKRVETRTAELRAALSEVNTLKDQLEAENIYFRQENIMKYQTDNILGRSDSIKHVLYRA